MLKLLPLLIISTFPFFLFGTSFLIAPGVFSKNYKYLSVLPLFHSFLYLLIILSGNLVSSIAIEKYIRSEQSIETLPSYIRLFKFLFYISILLHFITVPVLVFFYKYFWGVLSFILLLFDFLHVICIEKISKELVGYERVGFKIEDKEKIDTERECIVDI
ncbi:hypothetical protein NEFER03_0662 [Nematocida sp. LUAm3]|nr:hypothetical protein NEFER03_0662 [Nematocida sp. LUAm3]KAI5175121.1 hypothetical protein NEFER02_1082 [Nematocida sp. LUAm2]KAI5178207.1 hypothetical protein NEFER01_1385 [Nematocida sp. LUAm1]